MADLELCSRKIVFKERRVELKDYTRCFRCGSRDYDIEIDKSKIGTVTERRSDSLSRTRNKIYDILSCNVARYPKFLTLTCSKSILDYDEFLYQMKQFFKKMKRKGFDLKYLWVCEHQTKRGLKEGNEGSYHAHIIIFNDEYIPFDVINFCWDGATNIRIFDSCRYSGNEKTDEKIRDVSAYVVKYITKEMLSEFGDNLYHCSRGLNRPTEFRELLDGYQDNVGKLCHIETKLCAQNLKFNELLNSMKIDDVRAFVSNVNGNKFGCQILSGYIPTIYDEGGDSDE